jgi:hypothetical protein
MALSLLQKLQYSSFEWLLIGVKQSWQYFMIIEDKFRILRISVLILPKKQLQILAIERLALDLIK